jgi:2-polyprenyl-3-methyl-5-hydroxy-6-metoxy-1,4-benzoquinol methylase
MDLNCNCENHAVSFVSFRVPLIRDGLLNVGQIDVTQWQSPQPLHGMKILEVGCGGGILTEVRFHLKELKFYFIQVP